MTFDKWFKSRHVCMLVMTNIDIYLFIFVFDTWYSRLAKISILASEFGLLIFVYQYLCLPNDMIWVPPGAQFSCHQEYTSFMLGRSFHIWLFAKQREKSQFLNEEMVKWYDTSIFLIRIKLRIRWDINYMTITIFYKETYIIQ